MNQLIKRGKEIAHYIDVVAKLRCKVFHEYPYLYEGDLIYEHKYLSRYLNSPNSVLILMLDDDVPVGASLAMPMACEMDAIQKPFIEAGMKLNEWYYFAESVLLPQYRFLGLYKDFMRIREEAARRAGCDKVCFCAIERPYDHILKPKDYRSLNEVWVKYGFSKQEKLFCMLSYREIGETVESPKKMCFWTKILN